MMTLPGPRALLRRPRALEERAQRVHAVLPVAPASWACCGCSSATASPSATGNAFIGDFSKLGLASVTPGRRWSPTSRRRRGRSRSYVFVMFQAMFAIITPGADPRRRRRAHEVQRLRGVHLASGCSLVYCPIAHMVWSAEGLDLQGGRDRLRRRPGGAHVERLLGARRRDHARQAPRLRQGADGAAQPAAVPDRRRAAVDGLVRLQRRQRAQRERARGPRVPQHQHGGLDGGGRLGADRVAPPRQADGARRRHRRGGRPGRDHAGLRQRLAARRDRGRRRAWRSSVTPRSRSSSPPSATTTRSTPSASTGSAAPGARWRRESSPPRSARASRATARRSWCSSRASASWRSSPR